MSAVAPPGHTLPMQMVLEEESVTEQPWSPRPPARRRLVARLVQLVGLVEAVLSVLPHGSAPLANLVPTAGMVTARAATGVVGVLLVYLGAGLRRGKHRAWQLALALSVLSAALHLVKGHPAPAAVAVAVGALLVVRR